MSRCRTGTAGPLQGVCAAILIDAIYVNGRGLFPPSTTCTGWSHHAGRRRGAPLSMAIDTPVGNQPFYTAIGVDPDGRRDVPGRWAGHGGGESATLWMNVLTDLKNRGVRDLFFVVCDDPRGRAGRGHRRLPRQRSCRRA